MAYVSERAAKCAITEMQTLALLLPEPGKKWAESDWGLLNSILSIAVKTISLAIKKKEEKDGKSTSGYT